MRCSSAVVLSGLAVGQAAAANVHNRHASFHARREAAKRADNNVNWDAVAYDLKDVKWDQVNWSSVFTQSAAATPTPTPEEKKPVTSAVVSPTPEPKKETPVPSSTKPADTPKPSATSKPDLGDVIGDIVGDIMDGVQALASKLDFKVGKNSKTDDGGIWIGSGGKYGMDVTNKGSDFAVWYCWVSPKGVFTSAFVQSSTPDISVGLKPGKSVSLNFPTDIGTACAPAKSGTSAKMGMISDTWAEAHFGGGYGTFDVSRNPNMKGTAITMKGSKCTSDFQNCAFQCKEGDSCTYGYDLVNCGPHNGGHGGFDSNMGGMGGGCQMDESAERLKVAFY